MKISVILPVRNEEAAIADTLRHLRGGAAGAGLELIVVDGQSRDDTRGAAARFADRVIEAHRPGRAYQMHLGAQASRGDVLLFLHADTRLSPGWDEAIRTALSAQGAAAAAFRLRFDSDRRVFRWIERCARLRQACTGIPQGDQGLAVKREVYFQAGGFPDTPLMEEYLFVPRLRSRGAVVALEMDARTSCRRYEPRGPLLNALRNSLIVGLFYAGVPPERLARIYR